MSALMVLAGLVAAGLLVYLVIALLYAETFL
jgi:K+-transporting ATPase KdpF subunit